MPENEKRYKPISYRMSLKAGLKDFVDRVINRAPATGSGRVRDGADDKMTGGIPIDWSQKTIDWDTFNPEDPIANSGWSDEALSIGFRAFNEVVIEGAAKAREIFDVEIWEAIRGDQTLETVVMHGKLNDYPIERVSAQEVWEKNGHKIPPGEIPIMMAKDKYGKEEALWRVGAGKGCGMAILVSDDSLLRKQWISAVTTGLDAHWPGTIAGAVLSENVWEPVQNLDHNRVILPIHGESAKKALAKFRSGKGYPGKRILIADMGRVGRVNPSLVGEIVAAAREGKESGDVGVIATMSVGDYEGWNRSLHRHWNRALVGAGVFTGGYLDMDTAERTARAFSRGSNPEMAEILMGLGNTRIAMLAGVRVDQIVEGWILGNKK